MRRPARHVLKQPNGPDASISAEIEPVMRAARHTDQITRLNFDRKHWRTWWMNVEQATALDDEADFVFVVPVLAVELVEHDVEVGGVRIDVDHVCRHVPASRFQLVD